LTDLEAQEDLPRDLGGGLILRRSSVADGEAVAEFHANTLLDVGEEPPLERLYYWILDLMSGEHPDFDPRDFTIVEDTATGKIVSSVGLMSQTWTYEGIPFPAGQPDVVSTDPAYRRRGLVRAQMAQIHRWSAARGELVQGITGIPWYYRQFGYEMALSLGANRVAYPANIPRLNAGESEPFAVRLATPDDLPFIMAMYRQMTSRSVVATQRDEALWRFDLERRHAKSGMSGEFRVIESPDGEPAGVLHHPRRLWGTQLGVSLFEVKHGVPWLTVTPGVMRYLDATGKAYAERDGGTYDAINFDLGEAHPMYDTVPHRLPRVGRPYAWYIRVPDVLPLMRLIAPALERRLAASAQAGYSGELTISFFHDGLRLTFTDGAITIDRWRPERIEAGQAFFPDRTFLPLLFGFRSLADLEYAYPDCSAATDDARALLPILFPKKDSMVWSGG
jgi:hypothetical protein